MLAQYEDFNEVARAIADVYDGELAVTHLRPSTDIREAIIWLEELGYAHGDISDNNILLAREEPSAFVAPKKRMIHLIGDKRSKPEVITLCRRKQGPDEEGDYGVLYDLDMTGSLDPRSEVYLWFHIDILLPLC